MKNLVFTSLFIVFTILQLSASNAPVSKLQVLKYEKAVILNFSELVSEGNSFTVTDSEDFVVFSKELANYEQGVKFKLGNLRFGQYTIKIEGDNYIELYDAHISQDLLTIENSETHIRPSLTNMGDKIMVDAILSNKEDILVTIFDAKSGDTVYDFRETAMGNFQRVFNLKDLEKGTYKVVVSTGYYNEVGKITL